ncbi:MAG: hypothetical protein IJ955_02350, partial [Oscillospiraceae bacterium]|nr:hypothetical protein [Oscillospiraceae bacterium]
VIDGFQDFGKSCGILTYQGSVSITDGTVIATGGTAVDGGSSYGIYTYNGGVTITNSTVTASAGHVSSFSSDDWNSSCGIYSYQGSVSITGSEVTATGGTAAENSSSYGIRTNNALNITDSTVSFKGDTRAVFGSLSTGDTQWYAWRTDKDGIFRATPLNYNAETYLSIRPATHSIDDGCSEGYIVALTGEDSDSMTFTLTNHTAQAASVQFMAAAYDASGRMVGIQMMTTTVNSMKNASLSVSYGNTVREVKVFVLSANTFAPLRESVAIQVNS